MQACGCVVVALLSCCHGYDVDVVFVVVDVLSGKGTMIDIRM